MNDYILKINDKKYKIISVDDYFTFYPSKKVKSFTIYDENFVNLYLSKKFLKEYKKLFDSDEGDTPLTFSHIQKLKSTLEYEYKKYLKKSLYEKFLNDLINFEKYLNQQLLLYELENKEVKKR